MNYACNHHRFNGKKSLLVLLLNMFNGVPKAATAVGSSRWCPWPPRQHRTVADSLEFCSRWSGLNWSNGGQILVPKCLSVKDHCLWLCNIPQVMQCVCLFLLNRWWALSGVVRWLIVHVCLELHRDVKGCHLTWLLLGVPKSWCRKKMQHLPLL